MRPTGESPSTEPSADGKGAGEVSPSPPHPDRGESGSATGVSVPTSAPSDAAGLGACPPPDRWDDWTEYDARQWPRRVERRYVVSPFLCDVCRGGLLAYIDQESWTITRLGGNPFHPASRGRTCPACHALPNRLADPNRLRYPLRRVAGRGDGFWERATWDEALDAVAEHLRAAVVDGRTDELVYHAGGRPPHDIAGEVFRGLNADALAGDASVDDAAARLAWALWTGHDEAPVHLHGARLILAVGSALDGGADFSAVARQISDARREGAELAVIAPVLTQTAARADRWLAAWPGSEAAVLLAVAKWLLDEDRVDRAFVESATNWREWLVADAPDAEPQFGAFVRRLREHYEAFTPQFAEAESGVPAAAIVEFACRVADAGRGLRILLSGDGVNGSLGGWQAARCMILLAALTGSLPPPEPAVGDTPAGGVSVWNAGLWPAEYPLAGGDATATLPHRLGAGAGRVSALVGRDFNPIHTYPDGFAWIGALRDESKIAFHAALTPVWHESAWYADYVLPVGLPGEGHRLDVTRGPAGARLMLDQPVVASALARLGRVGAAEPAAGLGEVRDEADVWLDIAWRADRDGSLGLRQRFESPNRPGERMSVAEHYARRLGELLPGLVSPAGGGVSTAFAQLRRFGVFPVSAGDGPPASPLPAEPPAEAAAASGAGEARAPTTASPGAAPGWSTPSGRLEIYSSTLAGWRWGEYALPGYVRGQVGRHAVNRARGEFALVPTVQPPPVAGVDAASAKWLLSLVHTNPVWLNPEDGVKLGVATGDAVRVRTEIGHLVARVWLTGSVRPGLAAMLRGAGRWRRQEATGVSAWASALMDLRGPGIGSTPSDGVPAALALGSAGRWSLRPIHDVEPFESPDPETERLTWREAGAPIRLAFPVHPDPVSGQHAWFQKVVIEPAKPDDVVGSVEVDAQRAGLVFRDWLALARPAPGPDRLRRPRWLPRPEKAGPAAYCLPEPPPAPPPEPPVPPVETADGEPDLPATPADTLRIPATGTPAAVRSTGDVSEPTGESPHGIDPEARDLADARAIPADATVAPTADVQVRDIDPHAGPPRIG